MAFEIVTDTSSNLIDSIIEQYELHILPLTFLIDGQEHKSYLKGEKSNLQKFYTMMREGKMITTSLPNLAETEETFRSILACGKDVLYIGFSSGLSGTYEATAALMDTLQAEFPNQKLLHVDTLAASGGEGMAVYYACKKRESGASIDEVYTWLEENKLHVAHWFTVDDLNFLFRGGRVSKTSAWAGTLLNIKPVMHVDDEGHLIPVAKVRGRKKSIVAMADHMKDNLLYPDEPLTVFITHGDCEEDAQYLASLVKERYNVEYLMINYVDPVIGAHSGPGTLALFFMAKSRN